MPRASRLRIGRSQIRFNAADTSACSDKSARSSENWISCPAPGNRRANSCSVASKMLNVQFDAPSMIWMFFNVAETYNEPPLAQLHFPRVATNCRCCSSHSGCCKAMTCTHNWTHSLQMTAAVSWPFIFTEAPLMMERTSCRPFPQNEQMTSEPVIASHRLHHSSASEVR